MQDLSRKCSFPYHAATLATGSLKCIGKYTGVFSVTHFLFSGDVTTAAVKIPQQLQKNIF